MLTATWTQVGHTIGLTTLGQFFPAFFNALILSVFSFLTFVMFGILWVWLAIRIFLVIIDFLFLASFSSVAGFTFLFKPTRSLTFAWLKMFVGALASTAGLAISLSLSFYLIHSVPEVYNRELESGAYPKLLKISDSSPIIQLREFVVRIGRDPAGPWAEYYIPMTIADVWFYHMLIVAFVSFVASKRITDLLERIVGAVGATQDNRLANSMALSAGSKLATGTMVAGGAAGVAASVGGGAALKGMSATSRYGAEKLRKVGMPDVDLKNANIFGAVARRSIREKKHLGGHK
jgi:hypothetical protein